MAEPDVLPRLLSGRYRLEATLGQGGMGVVYRGTDLTTHRPIAVKVLRSIDGSAVDEETAGRFLREARNTARIRHDHIIDVFDLGQADGSGLYFVMELLEGESLAQRLRRDGRLSPEVTVHIGRQICEALQVAHAAGVIHRDLKPANIMLLRRPGNDAFVKVLDFGVAKSFGGAKADETQLTRAGMLVGTVDYMAPEQITGREIDGRTDIYALGILLYRMLAGKPPFGDLGVPQLISAHVNTLPKPLNEVVPGVPSELDLVILRCLAKKPERRYESMAELGRALELSLRPPSVPPGGHDPRYDDDDRTAVGKAPPRSQLGGAPLPVLGDETVNGRMAQREDETLMMEAAPRLPGVLPAAGMPAPTGRMPPRHPGFSQPPVPPPYSAGPPRVEPNDGNALRVCAICQAVNAPHVLACVGCGSALPPGRTSGPPVHAPYAVQTPMHAYPPTPPNYVDPHAFGPPGAGPWGHPPPPAPPPSIWQRFLTWTGLRSR